MKKNSTQQNPLIVSGGANQPPLLHTVKIADIAFRDAWQVRNKINETTVNSYKAIYKNGGEMPPVELALIDGALHLVDGWHRVAALRLLGITEVDANVTQMAIGEARWAAARANLSHGLPLKPKEMRNVFRAYISSRQHYKANGRIKSYRDMEAELSNRVSYRTLNRWMEIDHPRLAKEMSKQHGGEEKGHFHDGRPPEPDFITTLQAAVASLDNALAEARSLRPDERRELLRHFRSSLTRLEKLPQWSPDELAAGLHLELENPDF